MRFSTLKVLRSMADFESGSDLKAVNTANSTYVEPDSERHPSSLPSDINRLRPTQNGVGLNLAYTINLNLPSTTDQAVFNAIFKSLREHLLNGDE